MAKERYIARFSKQNEGLVLPGEAGSLPPKHTECFIKPRRQWVLQAQALLFVLDAVTGRKFSEALFHALQNLPAGQAGNVAVLGMQFPTPEFELIDQLLSMRNSAGLTQQELAERMGTQKSNVSRLEHGRSNPSWKMLTRYAYACGYELKLTTLERSA